MYRLVLVVLVACHSGAPQAPRPVMGNAHRAIATKSPEAQREFDLGLDALYAFNFDEAAFRFALGLRDDPSCAMCLWGYAMALGPNINAADKEMGGARAAAERAVKLATAPVERDLANALLARYVPAPEEFGPPIEPARRDQLHAAYADAMAALARKYPDDFGVQVAYGEALLIATPRMTPNWDRAGAPSSPHVTEAKEVLLRVLHAAPDHVGAIHFFIHVLDGSPKAAEAAPYADRLARLAPDAGHLVHMASHIYLQIGRYADAEDSNLAAIRVDAAFLDRSPPGTEYEGFTAHPAHFLWYVLLLEGKHADALHYADHVSHHVQAPPDVIKGFGLMMHATTAVRFGDWDAALALSEADATNSGPWVGLHWAKGLALVAKGKLDDAAREVDEIRKAHEHKKPPQPGEPPRPKEVEAKETAQLDAMIESAAQQIAGAIAFARGDKAGAIAALEKAVAAEDAMPPPGELKPNVVSARQRLGAYLLAAGRAADAERIYREDLAEQPETGWSLFGLATALDAQHSPEAAKVWERFRAAWKRSDVKLTASVVM